MSKLIEDFKTTLKDLEEFEKGKIAFNKTTIGINPLKVYSSKEIKKIRNSTKLSQSYFAALLGVSKKTIEAWEAGTNKPNGSATRLLTLIEQNPNFPIESGIYYVKKDKMKKNK